MRSQKISWDLKRFWIIIRVCGLRLAHQSYSGFQYFFMSGDNFWVICSCFTCFLIKGYFRRFRRPAPGSLHWILCCEGFPKQIGIFSTGLVLHYQAQLDQYLCICVFMYMYIVEKLNGLLFFNCFGPRQTICNCKICASWPLLRISLMWKTR